MRILFFRILFFAGLFLVCGFSVAQSDSARQIAVIVHPDVPDEDLNLGQVKRLLMGDRQFWASGLRVTLLVRAPVAAERDVLLKKIYKMSEAQFRQYWIGKVFRADAASGPKVVYSSAMAVQLVQAIPGSITFVDAQMIPEGVRVVRIDGKLPGDPDYPLH